ncbi:hypothetical protein IJI31_06475 [bacterium]|nr:hypothetical protein [bacterium]
MIRVLIPTDADFEYKKCKKMYKKYQRLVGDNQEFRDLVKNTFFYSFYDDAQLLGCIYYYTKNDKLFVNAFANRHTHEKNLLCLKKTFEWFKCDIYAETKHKTAIYCLYKCGFKKIDDCLYKLER